MNKWPLVPLGELLRKSEQWIDLEPDKVYKEVTVRLWGNGVTLRRQATGAEIAATSRMKVAAGQFIISRIDARNGASGLIPEELNGAIVSSDFPVFASVPEKLAPDFLGWLSKTRSFIDLCKRASEGTTNRVRLKEERFLAMTIPLPPLADQRRLVKQIDAIAAKIEEAKRLRSIATDESLALAKATMRSVFGLAHDAPSVPLHSICSAIIDCLHSNPVYSEQGIPTVRSPDVGWGKIDLRTALKTDEAEYLRRTVRGEPTTEDIVVVREGGGTGKAGIVEKGQRFSLGQRVMLLRPDRASVEPKYLLYHWLSPLIYDDQIMNRMLGSASPHLNIGLARLFPIRLPALAIQRRIVTYLDELRAKHDLLHEQQRATAEQLSAVLPSVLDRAFNGEL